MEAPKILLVEDEVFIQEILLAQLEEAGFDIVTANDGNPETRSTTANRP